MSKPIPEYEIVLEPLSLHQRSESPAVGGQRVQLASLDQKLDAVEVTLGGCQVKRRPVVVIASFHVNVG